MIKQIGSNLVNLYGVFNSQLAVFVDDWLVAYIGIFMLTLNAPTGVGGFAAGSLYDSTLTSASYESPFRAPKTNP